LTAPEEATLAGLEQAEIQSELWAARRLVPGDREAYTLCSPTLVISLTTSHEGRGSVQDPREFCLKFVVSQYG
jgi:hypothetical protein